VVATIYALKIPLSPPLKRGRAVIRILFIPPFIKGGYEHKDVRGRATQEQLPRGDLTAFEIRCAHKIPLNPPLIRGRIVNRVFTGLAIHTYGLVLRNTK